MKRLGIILAVVLFTALSTNMEAQKKNKKQKEAPKEPETHILISTSLGDITIKLCNETKLHKANFIKLVTENFYNDILFHRVIKDFMVQAGDPNSKGAEAGAQLGSGGPGYQIPAEIIYGLYHKKGALSAARTGDQGNPTRMSSGSQFYIVHGKKFAEAELKQLEARYGTTLLPEQMAAYVNVGGAPHLDGQYTVFGEVVEGLDIIDKIAAVETAPGDRPKTDVKIISMKIIDKKIEKSKK